MTAPPVEAISLQGVGHNLYTWGMASRALTFFGLDGSTGPGPDPQPGACRVQATTNAWNTGLTGSITITNTGTSTLTGWQLGFTPAGRPDHHGRLGRHVQPHVRRGDGSERLVQRHARARG
ncbi:hypothetical protein GCM10020256_68610 [Streptomyces thermocoprophilus]